MPSLEQIKSTVKTELNDFEPYFRNAVKSDVPLLGTMINYIFRAKGKQVRPLFVFLSANLFGINRESTLMAATSVELLHLATLIHDDVVDEAYKRRGLFTLNALWKNKLSVLTGDYILAKGMLLNLESKNYRFLHLISKAVKEMSEGEILQFRKSRKGEMNEDTYFEIIRKKTATLIASSMAIGAASVTENENLIERMYRIGENAGIAFQIKDDIIDYLISDKSGKTSGNDIKEKKITLPLLYLMSKSSGRQRRKIKHLIRKKNKDKQKVTELISLVQEKGGLVYATKKMEEYKNKALSELEDLPAETSKEHLANLISFLTDREM